MGVVDDMLDRFEAKKEEKNRQIERLARALQRHYYYEEFRMDYVRGIARDMISYMDSLEVE